MFLPGEHTIYLTDLLRKTNYILVRGSPPKTPDLAKFDS